VNGPEHHGSPSGPAVQVCGAEHRPTPQPVPCERRGLRGGDCSARQPAPARDVKTRMLTWGRDITFVLLVVAGVTAWKTRALIPKGDPLPQATLYTLEGEPVSTHELTAGDAVVLHVWATWCSVCKREFDALEAVQAGLEPGQRLVTVAANSGSADEVRAFLAEHSIDYPVYLADDAFVESMHVSAYPTTYIIDDTGVVASRHVGMMTRWGMSWRLRLADD
jgi:peroxiredoxin